MKFKVKVKPVYDHKFAQWLVKQGHEVVSMGKGKLGDSCYLFKATPEMIKDFNRRTHEMRDVRI